MPLTENELATLASNYRALKIRQAALKKEIEGLREVLAREMENRNEACVFVKDHKILYYEVRRFVFDSKRFKEAEPDFYAQYQKELVETRLEVS